MKLRVKLFAVARELVGQPEVELELAANATVADVRREIVRQYPPLESILKHARWAVDAEFANDWVAVSSTSEVALIPPVSGG